MFNMFAIAPMTLLVPCALALLAVLVSRWMDRRDGVKFNAPLVLYVAVFLVTLSGVILRADGLYMTCEWMPWWTVEYWLYCY